MSRPVTRLAINESYITELLEVTVSILQRHPDRDLAEKAAALERCSRLTKEFPHLSDRQLRNAISDLDDAVMRHLNAELEALGTVFGVFDEMSGDR